MAVPGIEPRASWAQLQSNIPGIEVKSLGPSLLLFQNFPGLTWQRADEFIDVFYVPLGGLTWEEVVSHAYQVPHVHVRELQIPLALSPAGGG